MSKKTKKVSQVQVAEVVESYHGNNFDPHGSYTGINTYNPMAEPTQDADDL